MAVKDVIDFTVVWLDQNIGKSKESLETKKLLSRTVNDRLLTFDNPDDCIDCIITQHANQHVFLIVSASFGQYIVSLIYQLPQIHTIYVYCSDRKRAETWANVEFKISGVFTTKSSLVEKLRDDISAHNKDSLMPMSLFHPDETESSIRDLTTESATFMWYQLLHVVLHRMPNTQNSRAEMIAECRIHYRNNQTEQKRIDEFERDYTPTRAIWWYTRDCFVYRLLNKALRTQNVDIVFKFRFFISDLHKQLQSLYNAYLNAHTYSRPSLTVYRGQHLNLTELDMLKRNVNGLISMNSFLSTTSDRQIATIFADTGLPAGSLSSIQSVLFIIELRDLTSETKAFARVNEFSCVSDEDEVLFTIGAVFKVQSVELNDRIWHVNLQLSKEQNEFYNRLSKHILKEIGTEPSPLTLGWFFYRLGDFNKAETYAKLLLKQLTPTHSEIGNIYNLLGLIYKDMGRQDEAIESYQRALEAYALTRQPDSPQITATHHNLGLAYLASGDNRRATEHLRQAETILTNSSQTSNPLLVAQTNSLKAKLQAINGDYANAFANLEKTLETKKQKLPRGHLSFASTYSEMGIVQEKMGNDEQAFQYFKKAFEICHKCLPLQHSDRAPHHANIGRIHFKRQDYALALKEFELALDLASEAMRETPEIINYQKSIEETKKMMK